MPNIKYNELIERNKKWAQDKKDGDAQYFETLAKGQNPPFLYIGCCDSRKPINVLTQTGPGEMFIHRNVANQVSLTDMNILAVLEYSVLSLEVDHIIVCGHHGCGGVQAALSGNVTGAVEHWVSPIRDLYFQNKAELDLLSEEDRINRLSEYNVIAQLENICKTYVMHLAFKREKYPKLHGWVFHLNSGLIQELKLPIAMWKKNGILPNHINQI